MQLKPNKSTDFLKALTDEKIDSLLDKMMNDTDVKDAGREQIRKMPRLQKEMMLLPWMAKSGGSHSTSGTNRFKPVCRSFRISFESIFRCAQSQGTFETVEALGTSCPTQRISSLGITCSPNKP